MDDSLDPKVEELVDSWSAKRREFTAVDTDGFTAQVRQAINPEVGTGYFDKTLRRWVRGADAERKISGFGIGGLQLKSWGSWAVGVGALSSAIVLAILYIPSKPQTPQIKTYSTTPGQRTNITLSDGSNIILAPSTTIHASGRNIELSGEAVFTVNQQTSPFTVHTGNTTTRVLGTRFSVRHYQEDSEIRVAVADGKVSVNAVVLASGDIATVAGSDTKLQHNTNTTDLMAWTKGRLVFHDTPLQEVALQLSRWYSIDVVTDSALGARRITSTLDNVPLETAIAVLERLLGARAERNGNTITFEE